MVEPIKPIPVGLAPSDLGFDVTEGTLAQLTWTQNEVLPQLRNLGVKIAIDDFGSEYSSFDYVRAYRVNHLKIARSFINRSTSDPNARRRFAPSSILHKTSGSSSSPKA